MTDPATPGTRASGLHIPSQPVSGWNDYDVLLNDLARDLPTRFAKGTIDGSAIGGVGSVDPQTVSPIIGRLGYDTFNYATATWLGGSADGYWYTNPNHTYMTDPSGSRGFELCAPLTGVYDLSWNFRCDVGAATWVYHEMILYVNGASREQDGYSIQKGYNTQGALYATHVCRTYISLSAGDLVNVLAQQPYGGNTVTFVGRNSGVASFLQLELKSTATPNTVFV